MKIRKKVVGKFWKEGDNNLCYGNYYIANIFMIYLTGLLLTMGITIFLFFFEIYWLGIITFIFSLIFAYLVYKKI